MPRKYKRKFEVVDIDDMKSAMQAVTENHLTEREAAETFNVSRRTLQRRIKAFSNLPERNVGAHPFIEFSAEVDLADCIKSLARQGSGLSRFNIKIYVQSYIQYHKKLDTATGVYLRKYCKFRQDLPGNDWLKGFMNKFRLSCKKPSTLEKARKMAEFKNSIKC
jgi:hypothetical protein